MGLGSTPTALINDFRNPSGLTSSDRPLLGEHRLRSSSGFRFLRIIFDFAMGCSLPNAESLSSEAFIALAAAIADIIVCISTSDQVGKHRTLPVRRTPKQLEQPFGRKATIH
jgi:hypothetical protein